MSFPIHRANYRTLDPDFEGPVFVADIDRTYLATRFSSLRTMAQIPFERAEEKRDIDGMARLFREIRSGPGETDRDTPLYFVSASPVQLRPVIERKMELDGIGFDGTTFKDWSAVVRRMRWSRLREQVGFKLTALLANRAALPVGAQEVLIGDDLEHDPLTYCLYADLLAGRIPIHDAERVLLRNGVLAGDAAAIVRTLREIRPGRGVLRALIRLERYSAAEDFLAYGPRLVPCHGAFQMAVALWRIGCIARQGIARVASEVHHRGMAIERLAELLQDLVRRAIIDPEGARELGVELADKGLIAPRLDWGQPDGSWLTASLRSPERVWTPAKFLED